MPPRSILALTILLLSILGGCAPMESSPYSSPDGAHGSEQSDWDEPWASGRFDAPSSWAADRRAGYAQRADDIDDKLRDLENHTRFMRRCFRTDKHVSDCGSSDRALRTAKGLADEVRERVRELRGWRTGRRDPWLDDVLRHASRLERQCEEIHARYNSRDRIKILESVRAEVAAMPIAPASLDRLGFLTSTVFSLGALNPYEAPVGRAALSEINAKRDLIRRSLQATPPPPSPYAPPPPQQIAPPRAGGPALIDDDARRRAEEEQRRQEDARRQEAEKRRLDETLQRQEATRRQQEEFRRQEEARIRQQELERNEREEAIRRDEAKRQREEQQKQQETLQRQQDELRRQQETQRQQIELQQRQQEEMRRQQEAVRRQQEEAARAQQEAQRRQQEELRRQQETQQRQQQEAAKRQQDELARQQEAKRKAEEAARTQQTAPAPTGS